ncbi:MAG: LptA/OstA family protein [bacterium]
MKKNLFLIGLSIMFLGVAFSGLSYAENILIEADKQSYNSETNLTIFEGNVKVGFDNISVKSPKAFVKTDNDGKPQVATFLQGAEAIKNNGYSKSQIKADIIRLSLLENNITAQGNTKSTIFENQKPLVTIKAYSQEFDILNNLITASGNVIINYNDLITASSQAKIDIDKLTGKLKQVSLIGSVKLKQNKNTINASNIIFKPESNELIAQGNAHSQTVLSDLTRVSIYSDYQQYDKSSNTLLTSGNVKISYKDYVATGPKATFFSDEKSSNPNKIVFLGRSKIQEGTRNIEADKIEIIMSPKSFTAEGNVKTKFTQVQSLNNSSNPETPKIPIAQSDNLQKFAKKLEKSLEIPVNNIENVTIDNKQGEIK